MIKLGLLSLIASALAAPAMPSDGLIVPEVGQSGNRPSPSNVVGADQQVIHVTRTNVHIAHASGKAQRKKRQAACAMKKAARPSYSQPAAAPASASTTTPAAAAPAASNAYVAAPSGTTSAAAAPAASGSYSGSSSGAKGGVAYNSPTNVTPFIGKPNIGWCYNWAAASGSIASGIEYIPTLWGQSSTSTWINSANTAIANGATAVIGFNEIDHPQQANLDASTAASLYKQYITTPYSGKVKLVSPSVTNGAAPMGLTALANFMSACSDCGVQAINIHWYDTSSNFEYFKSYVTGAYSQFNLPIWITEFGTTDGNDAAFLAQALPWLDSQSFVERYAYFMAEDGKLLTGGALNAAGTAYASA